MAACSFVNALQTINKMHLSEEKKKRKTNLKFSNFTDKFINKFKLFSFGIQFNWVPFYILLVLLLIFIDFCLIFIVIHLRTAKMFVCSIHALHIINLFGFLVCWIPTRVQLLDRHTLIVCMRIKVTSFASKSHQFALTKWFYHCTNKGDIVK